jgi:hypothetical protein
MILRPCEYEPEIKQLLQPGHWPQSCSPELRAHAETCRVCGDLVLITQAFRGARATSASAAQLPPPGVLWWRAQLRRRNAAVERIQRPLLGAQIFALAFTVCVAVGFGIYEVKHGLRWFASLGDWLVSLAQSPTFHFDTLWPVASARSNISLVYLIPCVAILALLSGIVLYLASEKQ